jgi:hypothetical protein
MLVGKDSEFLMVNAPHFITTDSPNAKIRYGQGYRVKPKQTVIPNWVFSSERRDEVMQRAYWLEVFSRTGGDQKDNMFVRTKIPDYSSQKKIKEVLVNLFDSQVMQKHCTMIFRFI